MARAASSISLKVFGLTGAVCAMMLRMAASIFMTAPQQGQVTSKLDSRKLDSRFTTGDHIAIGRNSPQVRVNAA
jgi:Tfp pilus assembly protein PilN